MLIIVERFFFGVDHIREFVKKLKEHVKDVVKSKVLSTVLFVN